MSPYLTLDLDFISSPLCNQDKVFEEVSHIADDVATALETVDKETMINRIPLLH